MVWGRGERDEMGGGGGFLYHRVVHSLVEGDDDPWVSGKVLVHECHNNAIVQLSMERWGAVVCALRGACSADLK